MVYPFIEGQFGYMFQRNTYTSNGADASTNPRWAVLGRTNWHKVVTWEEGYYLISGTQYEQVTLNEKSSQKRAEQMKQNYLQVFPSGS